jgi:hypothetical protein
MEEFGYSSYLSLARGLRSRDGRGTRAAGRQAWAGAGMHMDKLADKLAGAGMRRDWGTGIAGRGRGTSPGGQRWRPTAALAWVEELRDRSPAQPRSQTQRPAANHPQK